MSWWTIYKVERDYSGHLKSVSFNPLAALVYLALVALLVGVLIRLWGWAL